MTICPDCGLDHDSQRTDYPVGLTVKAIEWLGPAKRIMYRGDKGTVEGHCDDGRAIFRFKNGTVHTFHHPQNFVKAVTRDKLRADLAKVEAERDQLRAEVKRLQDEIESRQKWAGAWKRIARTYREHANSLSISLINLRRRRVMVAPAPGRAEAERDRLVMALRAIEDKFNFLDAWDNPEARELFVIANKALLSTTAVESQEKPETGDKAG